MECERWYTALSWLLRSMKRVVDEALGIYGDAATRSHALSLLNMVPHLKFIPDRQFRYPHDQLGKCTRPGISLPCGSAGNTPWQGKRLR